MPTKKRKLSEGAAPLENAQLEHASASNTEKRQRYSTSLLFKPDTTGKQNVDVDKNEADSEILFVPKLSIKCRLNTESQSSEFLIEKKPQMVKQTADSNKLVYNRLNESSSNMSESTENGDSSGDSTSSSSSSNDSGSDSSDQESDDEQNQEDGNIDVDDEEGSENEEEEEDGDSEDGSDDEDGDDNELAVNIEAPKVQTEPPIKLKLKMQKTKTLESQCPSKKVQFQEHGGDLDAENQAISPKGISKPGRGRKPGYRKIKLDSDGNEIQPKEKSTTRAITPYYLYCQATTPKVAEKNPNLKLREQRRIVAEMWNKLSDKERLIWRQKSMKMLKKGSKGMISTGAHAQYIPRKQLLNTVDGLNTDKTGTVAIVKPFTVTPALHDNIANFVEDCKPIDLAAYLKLLGESITTIGTRLREHEGKFAVQGASIVLMDSLLCSLAPIFCLTSQIEEMNGCPKDMLMRILDNISYIMPGV